MAVTPGTERILTVAKDWFETSFLGGKSLFTKEWIWTPTNAEELDRFFVQRPDTTRRNFPEKLREQLAPVSREAKTLAAEMLWVMMLFPSNLLWPTKLALVQTVWSWSGQSFPEDHSYLQWDVMRGIGSGGPAYNRLRADELAFVVRMLQRRYTDLEDAEDLMGDDTGERFARWVDTIPGSQDRQFRHMVLHLLFPNTFERISSGTQKRKIVTVLGHLSGTKRVPYMPGASDLLQIDRRLLLIRGALEDKYPGQLIDFYEPPAWEQWHVEVARATPQEAPFPASWLERDVLKDIEEASVAEPDRAPGAAASTEGMELEAEEGADEASLIPYEAPAFEVIRDRISRRGLRLSDALLLSYHLSLKTPHKFVILTGLSGTGKSWLAEAYAEAAEAHYLIVPVAPNWNTNEDLLGFQSPLDGEYYDTELSLFLRRAARHYERAEAEGIEPRPFHIILDEMNLARVEHYFARFLSLMEVRARHGHANFPLAAGDTVLLARNVSFIGTVNVDETTQQFGDRVYDRAQVIEMEAPRDALAEHVAGKPYSEPVLAIWDALAGIAPFAFRVLDEISSYYEHGTEMGRSWEELIDDQVLQKILPRIRGSNPGLDDALTRLAEITLPLFPRSHAKVTRMRESFGRDGIVSFHL